MAQHMFLLTSIFAFSWAHSCPEGDVLNTQDHCLHLETRTKSWTDAESYCVGHGGHLASVHNQYDNNAIQTLAEHSCKYFWIGGICNTGACTWSDGTPFNYNFWDQGAPDSDPCISVYAKTAEWNTVSCTASECFICETPQAVMTDCLDWYTAGYNESGLYQIMVDGVFYSVYCNMDNGGGWTVFQRRVDGLESFWDRNWNEYKNGFNTEQMSMNSNFWLGLEVLHQLTLKDSDVTLRIEMKGDRTPATTQADAYWYNEYTKFEVGNESTNYRLNNMYVDWQNNNGNASTGWYDMTYSIGAPFSTVDKINDPQIDCVTKYKMGGWWLRNCALSSLNGDYNINDDIRGYGMFWIVDGLDNIIHPRESTMMIRPT